MMAFEWDHPEARLRTLVFETRARPDGGSVSVNVGEGGGRVRLKPGETLDRGNGEVHDVIGEGHIQVQPAGGK